MLDEPVDFGKAPLLQKEVVQVHLDVHVHLNAPPLGGLVYPTAQGFDGGGRSLAGHAPGAGGQPSRLLSKGFLSHRIRAWRRFRLQGRDGRACSRGSGA